jgi:hypothetical protein
LNKKLSNLFIKTAVRTLFNCTSRHKALQQNKFLLEQYTGLAEGLSREAGQLSVKVPPMRGVDEDMREWSFFMILEHNAIVNRSITATVVQLANGETLSGAAKIDPKKDVMPLPSADESQLDSFVDSITNHIEAVKDVAKLRGTDTSQHPVFGPFDAHKWNCMFAFHLDLHFPQAKYVLSRAKKEM